MSNVKAPQSDDCPNCVQLRTMFQERGKTIQSLEKSLGKAIRKRRETESALCRMVRKDQRQMIADAAEIERLIVLCAAHGVITEAQAPIPPEGS